MKLIALFIFNKIYGFVISSLPIYSSPIISYIAIGISYIARYIRFVGAVNDNGATNNTYTIRISSNTLFFFNVNSPSVDSIHPYGSSPELAP